jgi:hypothetical protein
MKNYPKLCLGILLSLICSSLFAKDSNERVELMKYAIKIESSLRHETKWDEVSWFEKFKIIEEAYAYKEGETCLVLGFKSQFKNGLCRLSKAEGIKEYKEQCPQSSLPCNPQIFGKASADKPFCVPQNSGRDLSKSCAKETFSHLAKKTKAAELKDIPNMTRANFDLDKIDLSKMSPEVEKEFNGIFSHTDSSLDAAISFTEGLCSDLKATTQTGHQPTDLKTCESHLALLKKGKVAAPEKEKEEKMEAEKKEEEEEVVVENKVITPPPAATPEAEECVVEPVLDKPTQENIKDVKKVTEQSDASAMMNCVNKLEAHQIVAKQIEGIDGHNRERDRYYGYWHQLDGEKKFGRLCDSSTNDNAIFTFVGPKGFSSVNVPAANFKNGISRISSNGKEYYVVRDAFGDYFELIAKDKLVSAPAGTREDIRIYHKQGGAGIDKVTPVEAVNLDDAKACIRERLDEYVDWITYPKGIPPSAKEYNLDVGIYNNSHSNPAARSELNARYTRTVEEIKKEQFAQVMNDVPDCKGILSEEVFSKQYDKDHAERIRLYQQFRKILNLN